VRLPRGAAGFLRLCALLFLLGLTASRVGVVLHELAGHYGVAHAFGCSLTELRLFLFGGGFVDYACPPLAPAAQLATELGGIGVQAGIGAALVLLARRLVRGTWPRLVVASIGALFVLHGLFYLVTGVHYGVGDGRSLHILLGAARGAPVAAGSGLLVLGCFVAARGLAGLLAPWLPRAGAAARAAFALAAIAVAAALHGAAFLAEQRVLADATYAESFRPQAAVEVERELRRFEREQPRPPEAIAARRRVLEAQHAPFPLRPVLGAAMGAAALAGLWLGLRNAPPGAGEAPRRALVPVAALCAGAEAVVVALDRLF